MLEKGGVGEVAVARSGAVDVSSLVRREESGADEAVEDDSLAAARGGGVAVWAEPVWQLRDAAEDACLDDANLGGVAAKVEARSGFDPVDVAAEGDVVEVCLEDLILRVEALHLAGLGCLDELLQEIAAALVVVHRGSLHADRGCPGHDAQGRQILQDGAADGAVVEAMVLVETGVLHRQHHLHHFLGDFA